jgi:hypothetical protein
MNNQPLLPGMEDHMETDRRFASPVSHLAEGAAQWAKRIGKTHNAEQFKGVGVGAGYHSLAPLVREQISNPKPMTPELAESYEALRQETAQQFEYLTSPKEKGGLGVNVEVTPDNPYEKPEHLHEDISKNNRLKVLSTATTGGHSVLSDTENDQFRAVHDAFGHMAIGRDFSREGEEAAFGSHSQMFSDKALPALLSETRAQNSYLINTGNFTPNIPFDVPKWASTLSGAPKKPKRGQKPSNPTLF